MSLRRFESSRVALVLAAAGAAALGTLTIACSTSTLARSDRVAADPPQARDPVVSKSMRSLLAHSEALGSLLRRPNLPQFEERMQIAEILAAMDLETQELERAGGATRHPLLRQQLARYRQEIRFAREAVAEEPPDYLQVAIVHGACVLCHESTPRRASSTRDDSRGSQSLDQAAE